MSEWENKENTPTEQRPQPKQKPIPKTRHAYEATRRWNVSPSFRVNSTT